MRAAGAFSSLPCSRTHTDHCTIPAAAATRLSCIPTEEETHLQVAADTHVPVKSSVLQEKYVHRDITSGNILLKGAGHACLADFGLAHQLPTQESTVIGSALQADSILIGTFGYMAPEYAAKSGVLNYYALLMQLLLFSKSATPWWIYIICLEADCRSSCLLCETIPATGGCTIVVSCPSLGLRHMVAEDVLMPT